MNTKNLEEIIDFNNQFVDNEEYLKYQSSKTPDKRIAIVTCMDTRLTELLPQALNIKNGDAKIIKNAGGNIVHPFGSAMRSIIVAVYSLEVDEVFIIPHYDCGVCNFDEGKVITQMVERGIEENTIENLRHSGIDINKWLHGFDDVTESLYKSVSIAKNHPLMPKNIPIHGLIIDPTTGKLDLIINGWDEIEK
ncbi:MAG: beta-class carbonic anhydrase [Fusobacteriaceae bacterium]